MTIRVHIPQYTLLVVALAICGGCSDENDAVPVPGKPGGFKTAASIRANRRAFDGAPPVIPHQPFGAPCMSCHNQLGMKVDGVGFAPMAPHGDRTEGDMKHCRQCHVFANSTDTFRDNTFAGLRQDLRAGDRAHRFAPPVMPHPILLRENCVACHTGPAAREEIRCSHPERVRCTQCHVPTLTANEFHR
jgi:nitrate reductase (cytochrome), electron transfer subunit